MKPAKEMTPLILNTGFINTSTLPLMHTVVPEHLSGKGIASALAGYSFQYARENNKLVMVYCPFVGAYVNGIPK